MPMFCRHSRLTVNCPICSREETGAAPGAPGRRGGGPAKPVTRGAAPAKPASRGRSGSRGAGTLRTRNLAREADDGFRSELVPGLRATADAERLARALAAAELRLTPPGIHPELVHEPDTDRVVWLALLLALLGPDRPALQQEALAASPAYGEIPPIGALAEYAATLDAFRAWAERSGGAAAGIAGEAVWSPARRFGRTYERLSLPGLGRTPRFDLLVLLGASGHFTLAADTLRLGGEDPTTHAAKRALQSGDAVLLERRAAALATAAGVPLAALDRGLTVWNLPPSTAPLDADVPGTERIRAALGAAG